MVKAIKPAASQAIPRAFNPMEVLQHKSCFLFGAKQTGKTTLIRQTLPVEGKQALFFQSTPNIIFIHLQIFNS